MKPLAIELFAGCFGWGAGLASEGFQVIGFDILHEEYHKPVPLGCELVLQDVLTLHGSQFRNAALIVASPPCQAYSYRAMPWKRAKALPPPSNELFEACFRIQREASEAAGRYIPMVVENVKGAQPWVGRAKWHYGSFYLWGDVPALMPTTQSLKVGRNFHQFAKTGVPSASFHGAAHEPSVQRAEAIKNNGGSWFAIGSPGQTNVGQNPDGRKLSAAVSEFGLPGESDPHGPMARERREAYLIKFAAGRYPEALDGQKLPKKHDTFKANGKPCNKLTDPRYGSDGIKNARNWWSDGAGSLSATTSSKFNARKAASAQIAKIPFALAQHIARVYKPAKAGQHEAREYAGGKG